MLQKCLNENFEYIDQDLILASLDDIDIPQKEDFLNGLKDSKDKSLYIVSYLHIQWLGTKDPALESMITNEANLITQKYISDSNQK